MLTITLTVKYVPEPEKDGPIMATLHNISNALDELSSTLDAELTLIHEALANMQGPTQDEVDAVAGRVLDLKDRIANIMPDVM